METRRTFVSYSRGDGDFAVRLASDLRARGADVWLDQLDIEAGTRWDSAVEEALRGAARVLVVLSPNAVASQNVLDEVSFAIDEGKTVVPVLIEACAIPMRLRRVQHVDFTRGYDAALTRLLATLGMSRPAEPAPTEAPATPPPIETPPVERAAPDERFTSVAESPAAGNRRVLPIAAAAAAVVLIAAVLLLRDGSPEPSTDGSPSSDAPVQSSIGTPAPDAGGTAAVPASSGAKEPANTPAAAANAAPQPRATPPAPTGSGISGLFGGASSLPPLGGSRGIGDAGLKSLLGVTRSMAGRDALSADDLELLADAQSLACRGGSAPAGCEDTASNYVQSTLDTVCGKKLGARPPASDEMKSLRYEAELAACKQNYMTVLLKRMDEQAQDAIRKIKAG